MKKFLLLALLLCMCGCTTVVTVEEEDKAKQPCCEQHATNAIPAEMPCGSVKVPTLTTGRVPKCHTDGCTCPATATCQKSGCRNCKDCGACQTDCLPTCEGCNKG